jgi:hypothetical protein
MRVLYGMEWVVVIVGSESDGSDCINLGSNQNE